MKKTIIMLTLCILGATVVQAGEYMTTKIKREIKERAEAKWPDDYSMQEYEIEKQTEAFIAINDIRKPQGMTTSEFNKINKLAAEKWPKDYAMRLYEIKKQIRAWGKLNG